MVRVFKHPKPLKRLHLANGASKVTVVGWQSSHALAIYRSQAGFASAMMLTGLQLADGFPTLEDAHTFNRRVVMETKLRPGAPSMPEVVAPVGGMVPAKQIVETLRTGQKLPRQHGNRKRTAA